MGLHACRQRLSCCTIDRLACLLCALIAFAFFGSSLVSHAMRTMNYRPVLPVKVDGVSAARFELDDGGNASSSSSRVTTLSYDLAPNLSKNDDFKDDGDGIPSFLVVKLTVRVFYGGVLLGYVDLVRPPASPLLVPDDIVNGELPSAVLQGRVVLAADSAAAQLYRREEAEGERFVVDLRIYLLASLNPAAPDGIRFWKGTYPVTLALSSSGVPSTPPSASSRSAPTTPQSSLVLVQTH